MRITLDANAIVSGFIGYGRPGNKPGGVLRSVRRGDIHLVTSDYILAEAARVLRRPWFTRRYVEDETTMMLSALRRDGLVVDLPADTPRLCRDPRDDAVIATAVVGLAAYLVTGDDDILVLDRVGEVRIVNPATFIALFPEGGPPKPGSER